MTVRTDAASRTADADRSVLGYFATPTAETRTRIAVVSDLHLSTSGVGTPRVFHRTGERLRRVVTSLNRNELDAVVFNGDLVQNGTRAEHDAFDRIVADLDPPLFAVPGNHDLIDGDGAGTPLTLPEFQRRYAPASFPYRVQIGGVDLIGLNSNASTRETLTDSYTGRLSRSTLEWLDETLDAADSPLVAVHHTLETVRRRYRNERKQLPVENGGCPAFETADELADVLATNGDALVVTGHLHVPTVVRSGGITEFTLPPLGPYPCGYTVLDVGRRGTVASFHSAATHARQAEALGLGRENDRVLLAAARMSNLPLVADRRSPLPDA